MRSHSPPHRSFPTSPAPLRNLRPASAASGAGLAVGGSRLTYGATLLLAVALPFESIRLLFALPAFDATNLKLLIWLTGLLGAGSLTLALAHGPGRAAVGAFARRQVWLLVPALVFLIVAALSAATAPDHRLEALKFLSRFTTGVYLLCLALAMATTRARLRGLLWAVVLGGGLSALLGCAEAVDWRTVAPVLLLFEPAPARVGGELRVSASLHYPTIAAMYFEMVAPLALALAATAAARSARRLAVAVALLCTVTIVLTLTRAGMAAVGAVYLVTLLLAWRLPRARRLAAPTLAALLVLGGTVAALAVGSDALRTRLATENDLGWYGATYSAPSRLSVSAGEGLTATVEARNTGEATWRATGEKPYALGYRWLNAASEPLDLPHGEIALPRDVAPGETIRLTAQVPAWLPPGEYRLAWGMLQREILWFRHRGVPEAETAVHVAPASGPGAGGSAPPPARAEPEAPVDSSAETAARGQLWPVALRMLAERPLLGVGPDNFRHRWGRYLGLAEWNTTLHANNLYLELLATLGVLGAGAFGWLVAAVCRRLVRRVHRPPDQVTPIWALGLGGSLLAFLLHGVLDYFLEFTSLYGLFWLTLGLAGALTALPGNERQEG